MCKGQGRNQHKLMKCRGGISLDNVAVTYCWNNVVCFINGSLRYPVYSSGLLAGLLVSMLSR